MEERNRTDQSGGHADRDEPLDANGYPTPVDGPPGSAEVETAESVDAEAAVEPAEPPSLEDELAQARAAAERNREQMLRIAADFDNFRKRSVRDLEDVRRRARQNTLRDLLPVFDNLERATAHADGAVDPAAVGEGIRMVLKQFLDTLGRMEVARIDGVGIPFDPSIHESIQLVESVDHDAGTVMAVVHPGYRMGEELLRPALVTVSKGPPAESDAVLSEDEDGEAVEG